MSYPERFALRVRGIPIPQGSKIIGHRPAKPRCHTWLRDANAEKLEPWRQLVTEMARIDAELSGWIRMPLEQPVRADLAYTFERPPSHYRSGRNAHLLKAGAPRFPGNSAGDVDKLQRAIFDALTAARIWADDTQVVDVRARKAYAGEAEWAAPAAGVDIIIRPLEEEATLL